MDKPLTVSAQRVLQLADTYARAEGCEYTGTDHLLLGMLHQNDSVAAVAFERIGVTLDDIASHLHFEPIDLDGTALLSEPRPRNFAVRQSLDRARVEAERLKDKLVGTEHILLGVLTSPQNEAMRMLAGISPLLSGLRDEVLNLLGQLDEENKQTIKAELVAQARRYISQIPPAVAGFAGTQQLANVAFALVKKFGLDTKSAFPLLAEWNTECQPPWTEADLNRMLARAAGQRPGAVPSGDSVPPPAPVPVDPHADAFDLIRAELAYQIRRCGAVTENPHEVGAWLLLAQRHLADAVTEWTGTDRDVDALYGVIRAVAVGVACVSQHAGQVIADAARYTGGRTPAGLMPSDRMQAWAPFIAAILARQQQQKGTAHAAAQAG